MKIRGSLLEEGKMLTDAQLIHIQERVRTLSKLLDKKLSPSGIKSSQPKKLAPGLVGFEVLGTVGNISLVRVYFSNLKVSDYNKMARTIPSHVNFVFNERRDIWIELHKYEDWSEVRDGVIYKILYTVNKFK
ncbi:hypothetical protein MOD96_01925 [Bacillus sp. S17B2]|uniref:hypothetical protein n=1 Tax=Bacillus sp. S17B2 TaxID=2918907 RepID=UPI0022809F0C|nr:hypothetical protein [Bacillus sp. S17B2]